MKIDCLMGTYGRYGLVCEALACFLQQTRISQATLLIYNQHPVPLKFEHPRVRVVNETAENLSLRHIRRRMHELAEPSADLIHWWDDDDLYLPWHLEDCLTNIGDSVAWKPASNWVSEANTRFTLTKNRFEGSWVFRRQHLISAPIDTHPQYTDHPVTMQTEESGRLATTEFGGQTSYIYRWDTGTQHLSGYGVGSDELQQQNIARWREHSTDIVAGGELVPADLTLRWWQFLNGTKSIISEHDWLRNRHLLEVTATRPLQFEGR